MKTLYQVVETIEGDCDHQLVFTHNNHNGLQPDVDTGGVIFEIIEEAICNLLSGKKVRGSTISDDDMKKIQRISVVLNGHRLVHRFTLLRRASNHESHGLCTYSIHF